MATTLEPFTGSEHFNAPPARVHAVITDLDALGASMPGAENAVRVDDRTMKCTVRPSFSFLRANLKTTVTVAESAPPDSATIRMAASAIGVSMNIDAPMRITADGSGSRLDWEARVTEMKGLITAVPPSLIRAAADQVIREGWAALRARIESASPA